MIEKTHSKEQQFLIQATWEFVKKELDGSESGHDFSHIERVWKLAKRIAQSENVDLFVVEMGALLHDIADSKFHQGDEEIGPAKARKFLEQHHIDQPVIEHIILIIKHISFKNEFEERTFHSPELDVIQDADRLDAIGAIGIARAFNYGGFKNRKIHDPEIPINLSMNKEEYKSSTAPTINHFYEKLLLLKDLMKTETGKKMAQRRHQFMEDFLLQFYKDWRGE